MNKRTSIPRCRPSQPNGLFCCGCYENVLADTRCVIAKIERTLQRLQETNVDELSPRQALDVLYALKNDMEEST